MSTERGGGTTGVVIYEYLDSASVRLIAPPRVGHGKKERVILFAGASFVPYQIRAWVAL
ncbi:hypothetical protein BaRGS_00039083, partial [Batillaria attramentaria]